MKVYRHIFLALLSFQTACSSTSIFNRNSNSKKTNSRLSDESAKSAAPKSYQEFLEKSFAENLNATFEYFEETVKDESLEIDGHFFSGLRSATFDLLDILESQGQNDSRTMGEWFEDVGIDPYNIDELSDEEREEALSLSEKFAEAASQARSGYEAELGLQGPCTYKPTKPGADPFNNGADDTAANYCTSKQYAAVMNAYDKAYYSVKSGNAGEAIDKAAGAACDKLRHDQLGQAKYAAEWRSKIGQPSNNSWESDDYRRERANVAEYSLGVVNTMLNEPANYCQLAGQ